MDAQHDSFSKLAEPVNKTSFSSLEYKTLAISNIHPIDPLE